MRAQTVSETGPTRPFSHLIARRSFALSIYLPVCRPVKSQFARVSACLSVLGAGPSASVLGADPEQQLPASGYIVGSYIIGVGQQLPSSVSKAVTQLSVSKAVT